MRNYATKMTMISSTNMEMFIRLLQVFVSTEKWGGKTLVSFCSPQNWCLSGWWFGTWILFSLYWEFHHPNWLTHIFQRGRAQAPTSWGCSSPKRFGCIPKFSSSDARMPCSFQTPGFSCRSSLLQLSQRFSQELRLVNQPIWGVTFFRRVFVITSWWLYQVVSFSLLDGLSENIVPGRPNPRALSCFSHYRLTTKHWKFSVQCIHFKTDLVGKAHALAGSIPKCSLFNHLKCVYIYIHNWLVVRNIFYFPQ